MDYSAESFYDDLVSMETPVETTTLFEPVSYGSLPLKETSFLGFGLFASVSLLGFGVGMFLGVLRRA